MPTERWAACCCWKSAACRPDHVSGALDCEQRHLRGVRKRRQITSDQCCHRSLSGRQKALPNMTRPPREARDSPPTSGSVPDAQSRKPAAARVIGRQFIAHVSQEAAVSRTLRSFTAPMCHARSVRTAPRHLSPAPSHARRRLNYITVRVVINNRALQSMIKFRAPGARCSSNAAPSRSRSASPHLFFFFSRTKQTKSAFTSVSIPQR